MHTVRFAPVALLALLLAACGARPAGSTTVPSSAPPREVSCDLDAVAYSSRPGQRPEGSLSRVRLTLRPSHSRQPRIAVFEEYSGGTGEMWRSSIWVGAVHASRVLRRNLGDYEVSVTVGGLIDGPSAGALLTAGVMAMMQGVPVRPDVAMTGTVNPDGTVGPVGGIVYKMEAAAAAGKRVFAYPMGQRFDVDAATGEAIDLWELGARLGLQVFELADVEDAYALLTGQRLPRMQPLESSQMVASRAADAQMRQRISAWLEEVPAGLRAYGEQTPIVQEVLRPRVAQSAVYFQEANNYLRQGLVAMAYKRARDAAVYASMNRQSGRMLEGMLRADYEVVFAEVRALSSVEQELETYFASLQAEPVATVREATNLLGAYDYGLQARAFTLHARSNVAIAQEIMRREEAAASEEAMTQILGALIRAVASYSGARLLLVIGKDGLDLGGETAGDVPLDPYRLLDLARSTTVAAKAVVDYHDAVTVESTAEELGMAPGRVRELLLARDSDYRSAKVQVSFAIEHREPRTVHEALLALAAAQRAFVDGSLLVMRDYSLGVRREEGRPVAVQNQRALMSALEGADRRARESAALAAYRLGRVPDDTAVMYERSRLLGAGNLDERLNSLRGFWQAAQVAETAVQLAVAPPR